MKTLLNWVGEVLRLNLGKLFNGVYKLKMKIVRQSYLI